MTFTFNQRMPREHRHGSSTCTRWAVALVVALVGLASVPQTSRTQGVARRS